MLAAILDCHGNRTSKMTNEKRYHYSEMKMEALNRAKYLMKLLLI